MPAARMVDDRDSVLLLRLLVGESRPLKSGIKFIRTSTKGSAGSARILDNPDWTIQVHENHHSGSRLILTPSQQA